MTACRTFPSGAVIVSDIVDGYLIEHKYYGYTIREAMRLFKLEYLTKG